MSHTENYTKHRNSARNHKVEPPAHVWDRLESRLDSDARLDKLYKARLRMRFLSGIAAGIILMLAFAGYFYLNSPVRHLSERGELESLEELHASTDYFYSVKNARKAQSRFPYYEAQ